jgi:hypothetical protein
MRRKYTVPHGEATRLVITSQSLAHRHLDARQKAAPAVLVQRDEVDLKLCRRQLADVIRVSVPYAMLAENFSTEKLLAIVEGADPTSFATLMTSAKPVATPAVAAPVFTPVNGGAVLSDDVLEHIIRAAGVERTLNAAARVEQHRAIG